tara:strand:+ start:1045 stop:1233 length:189 start_codon:yes stop_codon:yes gene_type:complete
MAEGGGTSFPFILLAKARTSCSFASASLLFFLLLFFFSIYPSAVASGKNKTAQYFEKEKDKD